MSSVHREKQKETRERRVISYLKLFVLSCFYFVFVCSGVLSVKIVHPFLNGKMKIIKIYFKEISSFVRILISVVFQCKALYLK